MAKKYRSFTGVLYPDSTSYDCSEKLEMLQGAFNQWAYVLHDKDTNADGTPKKPHYHWVGYRENAVLGSTIARAMELQEHEIEHGKFGWKYLVRYLTHIDHPEKAAYTVDLIKANFDVTRFMLDEVTREDMARSLISFIRQGTCNTQMQLVVWALDNGCYSEFMRNPTYWSGLLRGEGEHR